MRIRLVRLLGEAPRAPLRAEFGRHGGTIGRSQDCDLVLADPFRHISRVQAEIAFVGGGWMLTDRGSALPVIKDGVEIGRHASVPLADGDELAIGEYEFVVEACPAPCDGPTGACEPAQGNEASEKEGDATPSGGRPVAADPLGQPLSSGPAGGPALPPPVTRTRTHWAAPEEIGRTVYAWKMAQAELVDPFGPGIGADGCIVDRPGTSAAPPLPADRMAAHLRIARLCEAAAAASPQAAAALQRLEGMPEEQAVQALCDALTRP